MSFMAALTQAMPNVQQQMGSSIHGSQSYMCRVPSLPENAYSSGEQYPQTSTGSVLASHAMQISGSESTVAASRLQSQHYYVDRMMKPHPYSSLYPGFDMNAVRRKNATRETTGPLKAWLSGHRKNPYPTKGEKVMLAIATRMTLTQVSTWFANARRRMKKDNLSDDEEQNDCKDGGDVRARSGSLSSRVSHSSSEADSSKDSDISKDLDISDHEEITVAPRPTKKCVQRLFSPDYRTDHVTEPLSSPESLSSRLSDGEENCNRLPPVSDMIKSHQTLVKPQPINGLSVEHVINTNNNISAATQKPKIWSISEIISGSTNDASTTSITPSVSHHSNAQQFSNDYHSQHTASYPSNYAYSGYSASDYANYMQYYNLSYGNYASHGQQGQNSEPVQYL